MADVPGGVTIGAVTTWTLWVEATAPSDSAGDIVLTLTGDTNGPPAQDIVRATAVGVDLDVDSLPTRSCETACWRTAPSRG